jgi:serine/threonine protein kinase
LKTLHKNNVIHNDIKPSNILLTNNNIYNNNTNNNNYYYNNNNNFIIKICDFGVSTNKLGEISDEFRGT